MGESSSPAVVVGDGAHRRMGAVNRDNMVEPLDFDAALFLICPSLNYRDRRDYHALRKNNDPELRKALSRAASKIAGDMASMPLLTRPPQTLAPEKGEGDKDRRRKSDRRDR